MLSYRPSICRCRSATRHLVRFRSYCSPSYDTRIDANRAPGRRSSLFVVIAPLALSSADALHHDTHYAAWRSEDHLLTDASTDQRASQWAICRHTVRHRVHGVGALAVDHDEHVLAVRVPHVDPGPDLHYARAGGLPPLLTRLRVYPPSDHEG